MTQDIELKRSYRFTLETGSISNFHLFVKDVKFDFIKRKMKITVYDLADNSTRDMINKLLQNQEKEKFVFKNYDEKGQELSICEFSNLNFFSSSTSYSYENREGNIESCYVLKCKFADCSSIK